MRSPVLSGKRAFIYSECGIIAVVLRGLLTRCGLEVLKVGADIATLMEDARSEMPDVIFVSVALPIDENLEAIRTAVETVNACYFLLTAYRPEDFAEHERRLKDCWFVREPFMAPELVPQMEAGYLRYQHIVRSRAAPSS
jgi:AmiR/NasT family two-component response regulator